MSSPTILAISGSTRKISVNNAILHHIQTNHHITIYEGLTTLPWFNPDLTDPENLPVPVQHFLSLIEKADGVILCTPEYVFSLPGILKNAIEWCVASSCSSPAHTASSTKPRTRWTSIR